MEFFYDEFWPALVRGELNLLGGELKVMLVTDDYSPDPRHAKKDVTAEVTAPGYEAQRIAGLKIANYAAGGQRGCRLDADMSSWFGSIKSSGAVIFCNDVRGEPVLVSYQGFGEPAASRNAPFDLKFPEGVLSLEGKFG